MWVTIQLLLIIILIMGILVLVPHAYKILGKPKIELPRLTKSWCILLLVFILIIAITVAGFMLYDRDGYIPTPPQGERILPPLFE